MCAVPGKIQWYNIAAIVMEVPVAGTAAEVTVELVQIGSRNSRRGRGGERNSTLIAEAIRVGRANT